MVNGWDEIAVAESSTARVTIENYRTPNKKVNMGDESICVTLSEDLDSDFEMSDQTLW
jgi:hypothetical protein